MNFRFALSLCLALCTTGATAQTEPTLAQDGLQPRIEHLSQDAAANGFELGLLKTLRGVEQTLQSRYDYGLWQDNPMLPVLRLGAALANAPEIPNTFDEGEVGQLQRMARTQMASIDAVYVILAALQQQPDAERIRAAHADWLAMIAHNHSFWDRLAQEPDDDLEWIPNTTQTSALGIEIPQRVAEGWQAILADAEALLEGRLLIPHPLLPQGHGIDVTAYVADPAPLDPVDWVHGKGAYPYTARGPRITAQSWQAFQRLTRGNARGYAFFLN